MPGTFTGTLYIIVDASDDSYQIYNWGGSGYQAQQYISVSACPLGTLTNTPTPTNSPTITVTSTITTTSTISSTYSASPTFSDTPTITPSNTPSPLASATSTFTITNTSSCTRTPTNTSTITITSTQTATPTQTSTPTTSSTPSMTSTPLMALGKSSNKSSVTFGDTITFCINYLNDSSNAVAMTVWDTVPAALTFLGADTSGSYAPPLVIWNIGTVNPGASGQVCFWGKVTSYPFLPSLQQRHFASAKADPWRPAFALLLKRQEGYPSLE